MTHNPMDDAVSAYRNGRLLASCGFSAVYVYVYRFAYIQFMRTDTQVPSYIRDWGSAVAVAADDALSDRQST